MPVGLAFTDLMEYTDWERSKWSQWLRDRGRPALETSVGAHGNGRLQTIGEVVRHIFSAELRYVDRLSGRPITETATIPADDIEAIFALGQGSRAALSKFVETLPAEQWDAITEFPLLSSVVSATPRKIIAHVLMHEIRHWAQIATLFRLNCLKGEYHDFLFSPVLGGKISPAKGKPA